MHSHDDLREQNRRAFELRELSRVSISELVRGMGEQDLAELRPTDQSTRVEPEDHRLRCEDVEAEEQASPMPLRERPLNLPDPVTLPMAQGKHSTEKPI